MLEVLRKTNIITEYIPNNMTNYYQPLDCTTNWIIQLCNELTSEKGKKVIREGWVKSGIFDAIMLESKKSAKFGSI